MKKRGAKLYRADKNDVWNDLSISHSHRVKPGYAHTVLQIADQPSHHRTRRCVLTINDGLILQEFHVNNGYFDPGPIQSVRRKKSAKRYTNLVFCVLWRPSVVVNSGMTFRTDQTLSGWALRTRLDSARSFLWSCFAGKAEGTMPYLVSVPNVPWVCRFIGVRVVLTLL